jgi:hypothetical protein
LCDIEDVVGYTPAYVRDGEQWSAIVNAAEENRKKLCKALSGKTLFSALYGIYTITTQELKAVLKANNEADQSKTPKSAAGWLKEISKAKET